MQAIVDKGEQEDKDSIHINIIHEKDEITIQVSDTGGGFPYKKIPELFHYFYTTSVTEVPTYTYSGNFGVPFKGLGCGMP